MMGLEKTFASAFGNSARYFAFSGVAFFACWLAVWAFYAWELTELVEQSAISATTAHLHRFLLWPLAIGSGVAFLASAIEFLRRVYGVRKFLMQRGRLEFQSWPETIITFGFPIANFFVPWNRLDVIRETLRQYTRTRQFVVASNPQRKLQTLGVVWGFTSLVSIRGHIESVSWMSMVVVAEGILLAFSAWTFVIATKWLSELMQDFEAVSAKPTAPAPT